MLGRQRADGERSNGSFSIRGDSEAKVIKFTREKLLSLRKPGDGSLPESLAHLEGTVVLAKEQQDPVCWDSFDPDAIWAQPSKERPRGSIGVPSSKGPGDDGRRGSTSRWERGVALPPADDHLARGVNRGLARTKFGASEDAETPEDLWDDPSDPTAAAPDFSAFGASLDDDVPGRGGRRSRGGSVGSAGVDLAEMSETARKFDEELHGTKDHSGAEDGDEDLPMGLSTPVDPLKPLASAGTTIRSGSGDDVNVFEDFAPPAVDEPAPPVASENEEEEEAGIRPGDATSASSRLMKMIGVTADDKNEVEKEDSPVPKLLSTWGVDSPEGNNTDDQLKDNAAESVDVVSSPTERPLTTSSIPSNPWGDSILSIVGNEPVVSGPNNTSDDLDLAKRLEAALAEQKARGAHLEAEQHRQREEAEIARRREEEEAKRRAAIQAQEAALQAQQRAEAQARQQAQEAAMRAQQQQQQHGGGGHSQVEFILMERISIILENSWGRSDLLSILSALHSEDSRVIPLLGSVDALAALIARHPRRVALTKDPSFGAEMAVLVQTNSQWQQEQARAQAQHEELQRQRQQEQQRQQIHAAQQAAAARAQAEDLAKAEVQKNERQPVPTTNSPWFYADPQGNIQGPFGGTEMRQWLEAGYFKGDLPISQNPSGPFRTLSTLFPDLSVAFHPTASDREEERRAAEAANQEERAKAEAAAVAQARAQAEELEREKAAAAAAAEAEAAARAQAEVEARARAEAKAKAEAEARARSKAEAAKVEAKKQADAEATAAEASMNSIQPQQSRAQLPGSASDQNSSAQLKMLLGLTSASSENQSNANPQENSAVAGPPIKSVPKNKDNGPTNPNQQHMPRTTTKQQNQKLLKSQKRSSGVQVPTSNTTLASSVAAPTPTTAWGGVAAGKSVGRKKSMSEIQQEEAVVSARLAQERHNATRSSSGGGWANIAASGGGSTGWSGGAVKQTPLGGTAPSVSSSGNPGMQQVRPKAHPQAATTSKSAYAQQTKPSTQNVIDDFGANGRMSPSLENWCKEHMRKLNGSDDLTLIAFCMTLTDPVEIRQYLTAYLGSTQQVNAFASEFINRKGGGKGNQEEWESAGNPKRGRKKKGAAIVSR